MRLGECSTTSDIISENCSISEVASSVISHKSEEKYSVFDIGDNMLYVRWIWYHCVLNFSIVLPTFSVNDVDEPKPPKYNEMLFNRGRGWMIKRLRISSDLSKVLRDNEKIDWIK